MKKKLTLIELNEFNKDLLKEISSKYNFVNIKKLFDNNIIITDTEDKKEHYNLDPWVQWVSIHTGYPHEIHKIDHLADVKNLKYPQIWEILGEKG